MWILYSLGMFGSSIIMYSLVRYSRNIGINHKLLNVAFFLIPTILLLIYTLFNPEYFTINIKILPVAFLSAFFISYLGNVASFRGMEQAPNPGYSLIIQKSYTIFTSITAIFLFNASLSPLKVLAIIIILLSIWFIVRPKQESSGQKKTSFTWVLYSIYCFFAYGTLSLIARWIGTVAQVHTITWLLYSHLFINIGTIGDFLIHHRTKRKPIQINTKQLFILILLGIAVVGFSIFLQLGRITAPNPGYVDAINASSNAFFTILAAIIFKDELTKQKLLGIFGVTIGLILLITTT